MTAWLKKNKITVLSKPSGANRNLIENLWKEFKIRVGRRQPKTLQQLEDVCGDECNNILTDVCANLVVNYRKRLIYLVKNKGHAIDY